MEKVEGEGKKKDAVMDFNATQQPWNTGALRREEKGEAGRHWCDRERKGTCCELLNPIDTASGQNAGWEEPAYLGRKA